jgi:hypothetical protein
VSLPESGSDEPRGVLVRRPKTTIYTVLLLLALVAILIACLIMVVEWAAYGFQHKPTALSRPAATAVIAQA